ncbi:MAG: T9SS type A sorting domain-containing protein [Bacteroidetes bacterium]|nr:MAG: T9SS type A sorting domain-containing protein [Bacteroidota bacterium]
MKTIFTRLFLLLAILSAGTASAQIDDQLAFLLQNRLDVLTIATNTKGFGAALRTPDGTIWAGGAGISSIDPLDSINAAHRFPMGSISKTLLSACLLQLQDEGILDLDDSLHQYLPAYNNVDPNITLRELLQHVSGVYNYTNNPGFLSTISADPSHIWTVEEVLDSFVLAPIFIPGTDYSYTNTGFVLLGEVVKQATGHPYYEEIRTRLIEPLELNSFFHPTYEPWEEPVAHLWTKGFTWDPGNQLEDEHDKIKSWDALWTSAGAAGAWVGTPTDIAEWIYQLHTSDLLSQASVNEMRDWTSLSNFKYGLGAQHLTFQGLAGWGHTGGIGYISYAFYFPDEDISLVVQTNEDLKGSAVSSVFNSLLTLYRNYEPATSAKEQSEELNFTLFPNPASDYIRIQPLQQVDLSRIELVNSLGQTVQAVPATTEPIDISALTPGVYYARVQSASGEFVRKFVVH